jgi:hypothetical protein
MLRTIVYIDGFKLYYRPAKPSGHKWLNVAALAEAALPSTSKIGAPPSFPAARPHSSQPRARKPGTSR